MQGGASLSAVFFIIICSLADGCLGGFQCRFLCTAQHSSGH